MSATSACRLDSDEDWPRTDVFTPHLRPNRTFYDPLRSIYRLGLGVDCCMSVPADEEKIIKKRKKLSAAPPF